MPEIKFLTAKITSPARRVVKNVSCQIEKWKDTDRDFFIHFDKEEKKLPKGFFKDIFGEYKYWAFKRIAEKYKWVKDSKIKKHINEKLYYQKSEKIDYSEDLMDAYNVLKGHYSTLGDVDEYYKTYKQINGKEAAENLLDISRYDSKSLYKGANDFKKSCGTLSFLFIDFKNEQRLEALKKYIAKYSKEEPEMTNYMYTKYYLPRLDKNVRKNCEKIYEEFGTKMFVYDEKEQPNLDFIYDEFMDWKQKSKGEAKFPSIIDLSKIKKEYIGKIENYNHIHSAGFFDPNDKSISLDYLSSIRHEMIHLNQKNVKHLNILLRGMNIESIKINRPYQEDIIKAGIDPDYAYSNTDELIACAGKIDCSKYSAELKELLADLGLPEWVFDLKPLKQIVEEQ